MADKQSFEEQVRDELAGFEIAPEAFVWENVEVSLQEDKKRRWIIWFFLFAITGSAASYWLYHSLKAPGITETKQVTVSNTAPAPVKAFTDKNRNVQEIEAVSSPVGRAAITGKKESNLVISKKIVKGLDTHQSKIDHVITESKTDASDLVVVTKSELPQQEKEKQLTGDKDSAEQKPPPAILLADSVTATPSQLAVTDKKSVVAAKKRNPWKLYAVIDLGQSSVWRTPFLVTADLYAAAPSTGAPPAIAPSIYSEPASRIAFSFGAGIDAEQVLSKKWDIGISATYQYYASKINVGRKVNNVLGFQNSFNNMYATTNSGYYIGSADETYINNYHLFETGVSFYRNYKLGNSFSLRWQLGAAGAWLFTSNALHYDQSQNIYYKDNSLLHRFQINFSTGLEAGIGKAQRVFIGPQFTYFPTTHSVQTSQYDYRHMGRIGLRTHILLSKNKKKK